MGAMPAQAIFAIYRVRTHITVSVAHIEQEEDEDALSDERDRYPNEAEDRPIASAETSETDAKV